MNSPSHLDLDAARELFEAHADPVLAAPMKRYMRDQFEYLGIKTPLRRELTRRLIQERGLPALLDLEDLLRGLWAQPFREYQYLGTDLLDALSRKIPAEFTVLLQELITQKSWWDTVDAIAAHPVGTHFKRFPTQQAEWLPAWRSSSNMWLRRTAILFQLHYKEKTDSALLFEIITENKSSSEFFIQKAIGWALREYSHTNPLAVQVFVSAASLAPLSQREALRLIKAGKTRT